MSIYGSWSAVGETTEDNGTVLTYYGSHVYPHAEGSTRANVGISGIPSWCVPGHDADAPDRFDKVGPWCRLDIVGEGSSDPQYTAVVLDEPAARALAADLLRWADMPKAHPAPTEETT